MNSVHGSLEMQKIILKFCGFVACFVNFHNLICITFGKVSDWELTMDNSDDSDMVRKELDNVRRMIEEYVNMTSDTALKDEGNYLPEILF